MLWDAIINGFIFQILFSSFFLIEYRNVINFYLLNSYAWLCSQRVLFTWHQSLKCVELALLAIKELIFINILGTRKKRVLWIL